jgi:two-component system cell cycle sensor histidine kinase/response regulator CckA
LDSARSLVLVVDDDAAFREMIADALESFGFAARMAASADEALTLAGRLERPPGFLVTDVVMPGVGGVELARALSARHPSLGVVFVSGHAEDVIEGHRLPPARVGFLRKPFDLDCLHRALESMKGAGPAHPC